MAKVVDTSPPRVSLRQGGKGVALSLLAATGAFRWGRRLTRRALPVLTYHHVLPDPASPQGDRPRNTVFAGEFDEHVAHLARHYHVLQGDRFREILAGRDALAPGSVLITFDDGYEDNYLQAFPILRRHGVTAMFFLATDFVDEQGILWFDRLDAIVAGVRPESLSEWISGLERPPGVDSGSQLRQWLKTLPSWQRDQLVSDLERALDSSGSARRVQPGAAAMSWDHAREMAASGMTIGSHTASHQILSAAPPQQVEQELLISRKRIEAELERACWSFSYPNGEAADFRPSDEAAVRTAGYQCAFTQIPGFVSQVGDPYRLARIPVPDTGDRRILLARLIGVGLGPQSTAGQTEGRAGA